MWDNALRNGDRVVTFKERFLYLKTEKNVTLIDIAKAVHSNKASISRYISGRVPIKLEMAETLAKYFDVDTAYLLGHSDVRRQIDFDKEWIKFMEKVKAEGVSLGDVEDALTIVTNLRDRYEKKQ
jgi:transcriptional regulator with XRE-family HTH domain